MRSTKSRSWTRALLGLEPLPAPAWALSVSPSRLALARIERRADGSGAIEDLRKVDLAPDSFQIGPLGGPPKANSDFPDRLRQVLGSSPPSALSVVLPDEWFRLVFAESAELPRQPRARADVLAWKLKRLVPFRVEELRVEGVEVPTVANQTEPKRLLLGFAVEALLAQLESLCLAAGSRVGRIRSRTLGVLSAVHEELSDAEIGIAVRVGVRSWSILATLRNEPILVRVRPLPEGPAGATTLLRELRLTRAWLESAAPRREVSQVLLVSDTAERAAWVEILSEAFKVVPRAAEAEIRAGLPHLPAREAVPLVGVVLEDVA